MFLSALTPVGERQAGVHPCLAGASARALSAGVGSSCRARRDPGWHSHGGFPGPSVSSFGLQVLILELWYILLLTFFKDFFYDGKVKPRKMV